jgi:hypothetical protein
MASHPNNTRGVGVGWRLAVRTLPVNGMSAQSVAVRIIPFSDLPKGQSFRASRGPRDLGERNKPLVRFGRLTSKAIPQSAEACQTSRQRIGEVAVDVRADGSENSGCAHSRSSDLFIVKNWHPFSRDHPTKLLGKVAASVPSYLFSQRPKADRWRVPSLSSAKG